MTTARRLVVCLAIACSALGVSTARATVPPSPPAPTATIARSKWSIGDKMIVRGENWPEGKVNVQICGNLAINGTADCDVAGTRAFGVGSSHSFAGRIVVGGPSAPCPCVVLIGTLFDAQTVLIPIEIRDHPILAGIPTANPDTGLTTVEVSASLSRGRWWRDAIGVSPVRRLTVTLTNTGGNPTGDGIIDITEGKDSPATGFAASIRFESLDPGESTTVAAKFSLDSFAYGTYNLTARVTSPAAGGEITLHTSTFPGWLLVALIILIVIIDIIWVHRVRKRRREREEAEAAAIAAALAAELALEEEAAAAELALLSPPHDPWGADNGSDQEHHFRDDEAASVADYLVSVGVSADVANAVRHGDHRKSVAIADPFEASPVGEEVSVVDASTEVVAEPEPTGFTWQPIDPLDGSAAPD